MSVSKVNTVNFHSSGVRIIRIILEFVLLFVILLLTPAEATLGNLIKLVFVHGALMGIAQVFLLISGFLGAWFLVRKSDTTVRWCWSLLLGAFIYIAVSFLLSLYLMLAAWGGIDLAEPRTRAVMSILVVAAAAAGLNFLFQRPKLAAISGIVLALFTSFEFATSGLVMHPDNPIWGSASAGVKLAYAGTLLLLVVIGIESAKIFSSAGKLMEVVKIKV